MKILRILGAFSIHSIYSGMHDFNNCKLFVVRNLKELATYLIGK